MHALGEMAMNEIFRYVVSLGAGKILVKSIEMPYTDGEITMSTVSTV